MNIFRLLPLFVMTLPTWAAAFNITNYTRIALSGDSVMHMHFWTHDVEGALVTRFPSIQWQIVELGDNGTTVNDWISTNHAKLVTPFAPQLVIYQGGRNNSGQTSNSFQTNIIDYAQNRIVADGALPLLVGPQPNNTSDGGPTTIGYYNGAVTNAAGLNSWPSVYTWSLRTLLTNNYALYAGGGGINLKWIDSIHPGPPVHLPVAYTFLTNIGFPSLVCSMRISATGSGTVLSTNQCNVASLTASGGTNVSFTLGMSCLPMPWDLGNQTAANGLLLQPEIYDINLFTIQLTNIAVGTYDVKIDTTNYTTVTDAQLTNGWNASAMTTGPIAAQLANVLGLMREKQGVNRTPAAGVLLNPWTNINPRKGVFKYEIAAGTEYGSNGLRGAALAAALADEVAEIETLNVGIHDAAQPVVHTWTFTLQGSGGGGGGGSSEALSSPGIRGGATISGGAVIQ